jgi:hypothetical protein
VLVGAVRGRDALTKHWAETAAIALLALTGQIVLLYGPIYLRSLTRVVYSDHRNLVAAVNAPKPPCPSCAICPLCPPSKVITKVAEQPRKCWMTNHFEEPNPRLKEALSATTVIIRCNYRIEAPFVVRVDFAEDNFISGSAFLPDEGSVVLGGILKQGKILVSTIQSPSLPAQELITVTVQGTTDQFPRAVSSSAGSK